MGWASLREQRGVGSWAGWKLLGVGQTVRNPKEDGASIAGRWTCIQETAQPEGVCVGAIGRHMEPSP